MWHLLVEDILSNPNLVPQDGELPIGVLPGLGLEPNRGAVSRAAESYRQLEK